MNYRKLQYYAFGFAMTVFGFIIMVEPVQYDSKFGQTFDFSDVRWPLGITLFGLGIYTFYRTAKSKVDEMDDVRKCTQCLNTFKMSDLKDSICPECNIETEKLKGFFERHPELKK
jgi:hypothetical protein